MPVSMSLMTPVATAERSKASRASISVKPPCALILGFDPREGIRANSFLGVTCGDRFGIGVIGEGQDNCFCFGDRAVVCCRNRYGHTKWVDLFVGSGDRIQGMEQIAGA